MKKVPVAESKLDRHGLRRPIGEDFLARAAAVADERIVGRNRVAGPAAHIDAQDLAEQVGQVLRIGRHADFAGSDVEIAVRPEPEPSGIVVAVGGGPDVEHQRAGSVATLGLPDTW